MYTVKDLNMLPSITKRLGEMKFVCFFVCFESGKENRRASPAIFDWNVTRGARVSDCSGLQRAKGSPVALMPLRFGVLVRGSSV